MFTAYADGWSLRRTFDLIDVSVFAEVLAHEFTDEYFRKRGLFQLVLNFFVQRSSLATQIRVPEISASPMLATTFTDKLSERRSGKARTNSPIGGLLAVLLPLPDLDTVLPTLEKCTSHTNMSRSCLLQRSWTSFSNSWRCRRFGTGHNLRHAGGTLPTDKAAMFHFVEDVMVKGLRTCSTMSCRSATMGDSRSSAILGIPTEIPTEAAHHENVLSKLEFFFFFFFLISTASSASA